MVETKTLRCSFLYVSHMLCGLLALCIVLSKSYAHDPFTHVNENGVSLNGTMTNLIPGRVQAEDYFRQKMINGSNSVKKEFTQDVGGGQNVGFINDRDWIDYRLDAAIEGTYKLTFRVASATAGGSIRISVRNSQYSSFTRLGEVEVANTGGWQNWTTVETTLELEEGINRVRLFFRGEDRFLLNINWIDFEFMPDMTELDCSPENNFGIIQEFTNCPSEPFRVGDRFCLDLLLEDPCDRIPAFSSFPGIYLYGDNGNNFFSGSPSLPSQAFGGGIFFADIPNEEGEFERKAILEVEYEGLNACLTFLAPFESPITFDNLYSLNLSICHITVLPANNLQLRESFVAERLESIKVYPTLFHDNLTIDLSIYQENAQVALMNMQGQSVWTQVMEPGIHTLSQFAAGDLPDGLYLLSVTTSEGKEIVKLQKAH